MKIEYIIVLIVVVFIIYTIIIRNRENATSGIPSSTGSNDSNITEDDIFRLLSEGRKIQAIKAYRKLHGVGLKEAKEAVEAINQQ